jgi:hypothetical protein
MAREMFRKGDDLRGPAELRFDLRDDEATPPTTLLADCGVLLSRLWTVRPMPGVLGSAEIGGIGGEAARFAEDFESSCEASGSLGEMRPEWYDIACGTASGGLLWRKLTGTNEDAERQWNVELIAHLTSNSST